MGVWKNSFADLNDESGEGGSRRDGKVRNTGATATQDDRHAQTDEKKPTTVTKRVSMTIKPNRTHNGQARDQCLPLLATKRTISSSLPH